MRVLIILCIVIIGCVSCKQVSKEKKDVDDIAFAKAIPQEVNYTSYGKKITTANRLTTSEAHEKYASLKAGDTTIVKFEAPIQSVCTSKGCWMRLDIEEKHVFVKFKDYGFFVPTDASGNAIVQGKAYVEEVSVVEQQHLALDAGRSADYIASITTPQREYRLLAEGVLIKK